MYASALADSGSKTSEMKRAALYSSRSRTGGNAPPGEAGAGAAPGRNADQAGPVAPAAAGSLRGRMRAIYRRHEAPSLFAAGLLIAGLAALVFWANQPAPRELVQEDIDAAVLHTLDTKTLPSRAAKAAELVRQSVVRVNGFDNDPKDAKDPQDSKDSTDSKDSKGSSDAKGSRDSKGSKDSKNAKDSRSTKDSTNAKDSKSAKNSKDSKGSKDSKDSNDSQNARKSDGPNNPDGEEKHGRVGSGVVILDNGTILTNLHVVAGAGRLTVTFYDGMESEAEVVAVQPENDLAVIRAKQIPDDLPAATLGSSLRLQPGDDVVAVGFPFGIGPSVSAGVVSGLNRGFRSADGKRKLTRLIQFDAAVNPGNSGGPLVTMDGEVVGIVTAIFNPTEAHTFIGIGFAATIESAGSAVGIPPF